MTRKNIVRRTAIGHHRRVALFESLEYRRLMSGTTAAAVEISVDPAGFISGTVFNDINVNGRHNTAEPGLPGRTIYIDANNDHMMEPGEKRAVTNSAGEYAFIGLTPGNYLLRQVLPAGWRQTTPAQNFAQHVHLTNQAVHFKSFGATASSATWNDYGGNSQHTGLSSVASQSMDTIRWSAPVDLQAQISGNDIFIHYGTPLFTADNVMILPVKTGVDDGFELQGRQALDGKLLWTVQTDYLLPPHDWTPSYSPTLTRDNRVYFAGIGGTVYYIDHVNLPGAKTIHQLAYYGLSQYAAHKSELNATVFIDTPITSDEAGNIFFGVQVTGNNPLNLTGGLARISNTGVGAFASASAVTGSLAVTKVAQNCAASLSNDGKLVYVSMEKSSDFFGAAGILAPNYLVALDSRTLALVGKVALIDPGDGALATVPDASTASPMVGPDGDVYYGILDDANDNHDRGFLLHFNRDLSQTKTTGAFGWDDTASVVPASMVPSYHGSSEYLLMTKYNDYAGLGGTGVNRLAVLDPNATEVDPISGVTTMKEVLTIAGVTPDQQFPQIPGAVREWCINTAVVDPQTNSVLAGSEDGRLYRWNLVSNTFTQVIKLTDGIGEAYTPTIIGPDGTVYAINDAILFAVGSSSL